MMGKLDDVGCQVLPEEDYPRSLVGMLPTGKQVNVRVNVPNQEDENSAAIAYWQVSLSTLVCWTKGRDWLVRVFRYATPC